MKEFQEVRNTEPIGLKILNDQLRLLWFKVKNLDTKDYRDGSITLEKVTDEIASSESVSFAMAQIVDLEASKATIAELEAIIARVGTLEVDSATIADLNAQIARINLLEASAIDVSEINAIVARINTLESESATISDLDVQTARIDELDATSVKTEELNAVEAKIDNLKVGTAQILDGAITNAKIGDAEIEGAKIANATISTANIELGAITNALIGTGAIDTVQIADGSITDAKIVELTANKITSGVLDTERLIIRDPLNPEKSLIFEINNISGALQAVQGDTLNAEIITNRSITTDKIVANAITTDEIAANAITTNKILANSITGDKINASEIDTIHLKAGAITTDKIASTVGGSLDLSSNIAITAKVSKTEYNAELGKVNQNYVDLKQEYDNLKITVQDGGGSNIIKNSVGYGGLNFWTVESGAIRQNQSTWILDGTSKHGWVMSSCTMYQSLDLSPNTEYTISGRLLKATNAGTVLIGLYDFETDELVNTVISKGAEVFDGRFRLQFNSLNTKQYNLRIKVLSASTVNPVEITDLMLAQGQNYDIWSQANGETYTLNVRVDGKGVSVYSANGIGKTIMSPEEFAGYYNNQKIFTLNRDITEVMGLYVGGKGLFIPPVKFVQTQNSLDIVWAGR